MRGDGPGRGHCRNDAQLLRLEPTQPEQRGFTALHLPETVLVRLHGLSCSYAGRPGYDTNCSVSPDRKSEDVSFPQSRETAATHGLDSGQGTPPLNIHIIFIRFLTQTEEQVTCEEM